MHRYLVIFFLTLLTLNSCQRHDDTPAIAIIPQPASIIVEDQTIKISSITHNPGDPTLAALAVEFTDRIQLPPDGTGRPITLHISDSIYNFEHYTITTDKDGVRVEAGGYSGIFYALETLEQLINRGSMPYVTIDDKPRYQWRGMMLDVARHFQPKERIKEFIDILAYHKLNKFHWHLTDGIGWRIQIDRYPELTTHGAWRIEKHPEAPWVDLELTTADDPQAYGGYYTQSDIREIVAYAESRYIEVIPEIEMPGHSEAATFCYPQYACANATPGSGVYCPGKEETFHYLFDILDQVATLFPSNYIHIGGDEVGKGQWSVCPDCQRRMANEKLKDEHQLQSYFVKRISNHLDSLGKRLIGWDEIIEGGLAENATVMSWTGWQGGTKAAKSGHDVIMCPLDYVYLDHYQGPSPEEPQAWGGNNTLERVYQFPVTPPGLTEQEARYVIGGQANLWTETISSWEHLQYMLLPRLAALSETLWTPSEIKNWQGFRRKIPVQMKRYAKRGWNFSTSTLTPGLKEQTTDPNGNIRITLQSEIQNYPIHYTTDGTIPTKESPHYDSVITITEPTTLRAATIVRDSIVGNILTIPYLKNTATGKTVTYNSPYAEAYSGGGNNALTDNLFALKRVDHKAWQGFEKENLDLVINLGYPQNVSSLTLRFFQHMGSTSVMLPQTVTIHTSLDGRNYKQVAQITIEPETTFDAIIQEIKATVPPQQAQWIRIQATNIGTLPQNHPRKGANAWIFIDEIIVNQ